MTQTENYQLSQWAAEDFIQRADFNADNEKIDAALKSAADGVSAANTALALKADAASLAALGETVSALDAAKADTTALAALTASLGTAGKTCRIYASSYVGNGQYGAAHPVTVTCPFKPYVLFVQTDQNGASDFVSIRGVTMYRPFLNTTLHFDWGDNSVSFYGDTIDGSSNGNGYTYRCIFLGCDE